MTALREMRSVGVAASALAALVFSRGCSCPLSVLGPTDKPDFAGMPWRKIEGLYWVRTGADRKTFRRFTIVDKGSVDALRRALNCKEVTGLMTGAGRQLVITMDDGEVWQGDVVFENRIHLCLRRDNWYSYSLELADSAFHSRLRAACLEHEKAITPNATLDHIILRGNLDINCYKTIDSAPSVTADGGSEMTAGHGASSPRSQPSDGSGRGDAE